jgi:REP element-mobilizing transposase RayT
MEKRRFSAGALHHVYFITRDGGVLFYRISDRLSFYTTISVLASRYKVDIIGISIMFTHVHLMVRAEDLAQFRLFMNQLLRTFSKLINQDRGSQGPVFKTPFGSAPQTTDKRQRSSLIYLFNNPVEKRLCSKAVEDRWTFLAYYDDPHPFSAPLVKRYASHAMRDACQLVDAEARAGRYLRPVLLRTLFRKLSREEQEQLTDYVIQQYRFINYEAAIALYGGYDRMLRTTEETSGQEFDIGEEFDANSDVPFREMIRVAAQGRLFDGWALLRLDEQAQQKWIRRFRAETSATSRHIQKFLHLEK